MSNKIRLAALREIRAMLQKESGFGTTPLTLVLAKVDALIAEEAKPDLLEQEIEGELGKLIRAGRWKK